MRLLALDFETTGLDPKTSRVTELGVALGDMNQPYPLDAWGRYIDDERIGPIPEEIKTLTGITNETLREFGRHPTTVFRELDQYCSDHHVDYLVGHNLYAFDKPFLIAELDRHEILAPQLRKIPCLDTRVDIPFRTRPVSMKLQHLLSDLHRAHNLIAHRAMFDAAATLWLLAQYSFEAVLAYSKIPWRVVQALTPFQDREIAKKNGYSWQELNSKHYAKSWVKLVKENELDAEQKKFPEHEIRILE